MEYWNTGILEQRHYPGFPSIRFSNIPTFQHSSFPVFHLVFMLIFDQLKKNDPQLRIIAVLLLCGLGVLVAGLWWVQIVSTRDYQAHLEMQSFRTVRIPAVRGKILDRNGIALAENRPTYNISLYLDELRKSFKAAGNQEVSRTRATLKQQAEEKQRQLKRKLNKEERKQFILSLNQQELLRRKARYEVASNVVAEISGRLGQPLTLNPTNFQKPCPALADCDESQSIPNRSFRRAMHRAGRSGFDRSIHTLLSLRHYRRARARLFAKGRLLR
jgi:hypothetical protein